MLFDRMHPELRAQFNADFTPEKYAALVRCVNETEKWPADFRVSETPIFMTREFTNEVTRAAHAIVEQTGTLEFDRYSASPSRTGWKCLTKRPPELSGGRLRDLPGERAVGAATDRASGVSEPVRVSMVASGLHAQSLSGDSAELDFIVWRNQGRRLPRAVSPDHYRRCRSGECRPARDRAGEAKDPDRFCRHRVDARHCDRFA